MTSHAAIIFDMGNTLIDYHQGLMCDDEKDFCGLENMSKRLASWGHPISTSTLAERFYQPWVAIFSKRKQQSTEFDLTEYLAKAIPLNRFSSDQIKTLILDFHEPSAKAAITDEGTRKTLKNLQDAGFQIGMLSNSAIPGYCHDLTLELLGLISLLDFRLYSYDEGLRKPNHDLFKRAMATAGSTPSSTIMVGDSWELDLAPACELGIRVIHYQSPRSGKTGSFPIPSHLFLGKVGSIPEIESLVFNASR